MKHKIAGNVKEIMKVFRNYVFIISTLFIFIWGLLSLVLPEMKAGLSNALATTIGFDIPETLTQNSIEGLALLVIIVVSSLSVLILLVNVLFEAKVTAIVLNPEIDIYTSKKGCLSDTWDNKKEHILVRMLNFHQNDIVDLSVKAVVTVHEEIERQDGEREEFLCYFSIPAELIDPSEVLVLKSNIPWTIAIADDITLSNTLTSNYKMDLGEKITNAVLTGNKLISVKRELELLIKGTDPVTRSIFSINRTIKLDEQDIKGNYTLHLHRGRFKSLPMHVKTKKEVEHYI
jgi:hypothetical protein